MRLLPTAAAALLLAGCPRPPARPDVLDYDVQPVDAQRDVQVDGQSCQTGPVSETGPEYCSLGADVPDAVVPTGFCIRQYARIGAARVMAVAPNGDLFVSAPTTGTPGAAPPGPGAIVVVADDNRDGVGETYNFADGLPDVHGLVFSGGYLYYTTANSVWRVPYACGQRRVSGTPENVATFEPGTNARWTHGLAATPGGTLYATQGTYTSSMCPDTPRTGAVNRIQPGTTSMALVSTGYRNPLYLRCHFADEACMVAELGDDGGGGFGAYERMIMLRPDTAYGYPCCTTTSGTTPYNSGRYDCAQVPREEASFPLNDTPFGLDWERGRWPAPFHEALFVALHGSFYSTPRWEGTRVVFAATDPVTHAPTGPWQDFVLGFGPGGGPLERATDVTFAPDGRMFLADDQGGAVYWIAPRSLRMPAP